MEGVTVLNSYDVSSWTNMTAILCFCFIVLGVVCGLLTLFTIEYDHLPGYFLAGVVICGIIAFSVGLFGSKITTTYYEITIDETVNFVEFIDRYNITEQAGKIYTITEKGLS